ncbi:Spy/CpxP family protein refolding chaperone [uncultured Phenylobacterium sp.]|uniref:Spy/CpxP family protein refolding chaperone n=1 Tax=uncultured Phenylobacterium sp. TaxID=349273 RepID=UPI0025F00CB3|nr:Spy/CpxP family protein refolding chaperone [uncultured Phenylobacterium sp.]
MKTPMIRLLAGAAITLAAGATVAIAADAADPAATTRPAREDARSAHADVHRGHHNDTANQGRREETVSRLLQLRPEQRPALKAFLEATPPHHGRGHGRDHMVRFAHHADDRTTLQRLDDMQARAAEHKSEMDRKVAAIKTFYGQLDAKQKQAFDAMPMLVIGGRMGGPMMMHGPMPMAHRAPLAPPPPEPPVRPRS